MTTAHVRRRAAGDTGETAPPGRCQGAGAPVAALTAALRACLAISPLDDVATVDARLAAGLRRMVADPRRRAWLLPRLATLVGGSAALPDLDREDLAVAWTALLAQLTPPDDDVPGHLAGPAAPGLVPADAR